MSGNKFENGIISKIPEIETNNLNSSNGELTMILEINSVETLSYRLIKSGIDLKLWGVGKAKTLNHLWNEIKEGETQLTIDEKGNLTRKVVVLNADIFYTDGSGIKYHLFEEKQIFSDGRERNRNGSIKESVSEKMKPGENQESSIVRGIKEELGIEGIIKISKKGDEILSLSSPSFPGLISTYYRHIFVVEIDSNQYRPQGYVEVQSDKSTYFKWKIYNGEL